MALQTTIEKALTEFDLIPTERKEDLQKLSDFVKDRNGMADLIFICTHNSRRSHLSQVWAQVAAHHYGLFGVTCYSGGTEATAFFPSAIEALKHHGLNIKALSAEPNPVYSVKYDEDVHPIICFSKTYDDSFNAQNDFAAVMTCDHADQNCPFIPTAGARIPVRYEDPKVADGTPEQLDKYIERSAQICREMLYAFSLI